jgi:hypothetical protein
MTKRILLVALVLLAAVAVSYLAYARSVVRPPKLEQIAASWIGYTEDDLSLFRLTLRKDGTGSCACTFVREPALLYDVSSWKLSGCSIDVTLKPIDPSAEPIHITGKTDGWHLNLNVQGKEWDRDLKMYNESDAQSAYRRLYDRMERAATLP